MMLDKLERFRSNTRIRVDEQSGEMLQGVGASPERTL